MAAMQDDRRVIGGKKTSAIKKGEHIVLPGSHTAHADKRADKRTAEHYMTSEHRPDTSRALIADIIVVVLLIALAVGLIFGYRALKNVYDPTWDKKQVEFSIKITHVDEDTVNTFLYDEEGNSLFEGGDLYHTDRVDGDRLGVVKNVKVEPGTDPEKNTFTLYLTVEAEADYRKGEGYYVQSTQLLAGDTGTYRVHGMTFTGTTITLHEVTDGAAA